MRYSALLLTFCLCGLLLACQGPPSIDLQPTIEEAPRMASAIHVGDPATANQFFRGVYPQDAPTWRWAGPKFSVTLGTPPGAAAKGARLVLEFNLPEPSINALKQITLAAKIGGVTLPPESFTAAGRHEYRQEVPGAALASDVVSPEFTVDKYLQLPNDPRQLALIISAVRLESL